MNRTIWGIQLLAVLALGGCQALAAAPTATPTRTATALPTSTPTIAPSPTTTSTPGATATPALSSRGLIIFTSLDPYPALMAVTGDGLEILELFRYEYPYLGFGAYWAPDASMVAVHMVHVADGSARIGIFDTASAEFALIEYDIPGLVGPLKWSPDSRYLVFGAPQPDGAERDVYRMEVATGVVTNLTPGFPHWDSAPVYSPDGLYIYYTSDSAAGGGKQFDDIWRMNADGSGNINLTDNGIDWEDNWAAVNSDGTVAYLRSGLFNSPDTPGGPAGLWLMDADGQNQRFLASVPLLFGREAAAWSPDGKWLALVPVGEATSLVFLVDAATGEQTTFSVSGNAYGISWSPDSQAFHFTSQTDDATIFYIYSVEKGILYQPLDGSAGFGGWSPPVSAP